MKKMILLACVGIALAGCNSTDNPTITPLPPVTEAFTPAVLALERLSLVDVTGEPIANVSFSLTSTAQVSSFQLANVYSTDTSGIAVVPNLSAGEYEISLSIEDVTVELVVEVTAGNASGAAMFALPVLIDEQGDLISVKEEGFFASYNGVVYNKTGPLSGAQVQISAGAASNGAIATAITDAKGVYSLVVNMGTSLVEALGNLELTVSHENHAVITIQNLNIIKKPAVAGFNHGLVVAAGTGVVVYQETFNQTENGATCGNWMADDLEFSNGENLWHSHAANLIIRNQALVGGLVRLAPDDISQGYVPSPITGRACWYGQSGNLPLIGQGNFLGEVEDTHGGDALDGGTSDMPSGGAIVSPLIDLTSVSGPLSVTLRNWWEIESVNPNSEGYDLMSVQISVYEGAGWGEWETLARLNPFSDPVGLEDRAPLPFSNRGYNKAPAWLWQEPVDISEYAGEQIRLRLEFDTVDELYNGFRGWLIDEVRIVRKAGTFPRWSEIGGGNPEDDELTLSDITPSNLAPLTLNSSYVFSVHANYDGIAEDVRIKMYFTTFDDLFTGVEPQLVGVLPVGETDGTLTSGSLTITSPFSYFLIKVEDQDGNELSSETIVYFAI